MYIEKWIQLLEGTIVPLSDIIRIGVSSYKNKKGQDITFSICMLKNGNDFPFAECKNYIELRNKKVKFTEDHCIEFNYFVMAYIQNMLKTLVKISEVSNAAWEDYLSYIENTYLKDKAMKNYDKNIDDKKSVNEKNKLQEKLDKRLSDIAKKTSKQLKKRIKSYDQCIII